MKNSEKNEWLTKVTQADGLETPYMLLDLSMVRERVEAFIKLMPRVGLYYAIKSNSDPEIIKSIDDIVAGYDIASLGEFNQLSELGITADRVLYSNPVKIPQHIAKTHARGVTRFSFDSIAEIEKLKAHAPGSDAYLRVRVSDYGSKFPLSGKFGIDAAHAVAYAGSAEEAGLSVKGITFHVGSQAENLHVWEAAIKQSGALIERLKAAGINIEFLDLGGGFPANYVDLAPTIEEVAAVVNEALEKYIPADVEVVAEPGRFISANASIIGTTVIGREHRRGADWLYIDMGVFQGLIEPLEMPGWKYPVLTHKNAKGYKKAFILTGPTCDAYDTLGLDYILPSDTNVGDRLYLAGVGAYSLVYGSNFNGFEMPKVHYLRNGRIENVSH